MDLFTEGQKLTLFFQKDTNMVEMTCTIDKVLDDRLALILPQYFMRYIEFLQVGKNLTAKAFSKIGTIDFNTVIISLLRLLTVLMVAIISRSVVSLLSQPGPMVVQSLTTCGVLSLLTWKA